MAIIKRFLNEGLNSWSYYQYHLQQWKAILLLVERSMNENSKWIKEQEELYISLRNYYKSTNILDGMKVTRESFRDHHGFNDLTSIDDYLVQSQNVLKHPIQGGVNKKWIENWLCAFR